MKIYQISNNLMKRLLRAAYRQGFCDNKIGIPYLQTTDESLLEDCQQYIKRSTRRMHEISLAIDVLPTVQEAEENFLKNIRAIGF